VVLVGAEAPIDAGPLRAVPGVRQVEPDTDPCQVRLHLDGDHRVPDVVVALVAGGMRVTRVEPLTPTLEDLYFAVRTKKEIAEDGGRQLSPANDADGPGDPSLAPSAMTDRHRQVASLTGWPGSEGTR
jgi:hypothetical protein